MSFPSLKTHFLTINFQTEPFSVPDSSSDRGAHSPRSPSPEMGDSLFTPPPSRKPRRRVVLDCVSVPPFRKDTTRASCKTNATISKPQQDVQHPPVSHALPAAFAQNDRPSSPSLSRKGKERERERPPPAPARRKRKFKPRLRKFGEDVSTIPTQILDAQYPAIELDIHDLPDFLPHHDNILQSSTYYIYVKRIQRLYAQLHEGLPEMIAGMKGPAVPDDEKDEKEYEPVLPRVLAPLFQERPDIEAALTPYFARASLKGSSRKGKIKNNLEPQNVPTSSKSELGSAGTVLQTQDPSSSNVLDDISHYTALEGDQILDFSTEMDQYLNDLGDSPPKTCSSGVKYTRSAPNSFIGFLNNTTRLPPDAASVTREDAEDSFFGVPPSPKLVSDLSSLQLTDTYATNSSHSLDASFDLALPEDGQWSLSPTIEKKSISPESLSPSGSAGTIDPSLLGGSEPPPKPPLPPSRSTQNSKKLPAGPIIYVRRPPGVSASQEAPALSDKISGKLRGNVQIKYRTSESASVTDEGDMARLTRKLDDGEVKDDGGWTAEAVSAPPTRPGTQPSLKLRIRRSGTRAGSDGSFAPSKTSSSTSPAVSATPLPETKLSKARAPLPPAQTMLQDDGEPEVVKTSCHQCRNTNTRPKMHCSKRRPDRSICGKRFCNKCILNRSVVSLSFTSSPFLIDCNVSPYDSSGTPR